MKKETIYKNKKYELSYRGLQDRGEDFAVFAAKPVIANDGIYSGIGEFEMVVSIPCLGIDNEDYSFEEGLSNHQIQEAAEAILREL